MQRDGRPVAPRYARHERGQLSEMQTHEAKQVRLHFEQLAPFVRPAGGRRATGPPCVLRGFVPPCWIFSAFSVASSSLPSSHQRQNDLPPNVICLRSLERDLDFHIRSALTLYRHT